MKPPVIDIGGSQALDERHAMHFAVGPTGEADGAAGLVDEKRVARELRHVLVDEGKSPRSLAGHECGQGLDMLALAPRGAGRQLPGPVDGDPRGRAVAPEQREERGPRVGHGEALVSGDGGGKAFLGPGPYDSCRSIPSW